MPELADDAIDRMRSDVNNVGFTAISFGGVTLPADPAMPEEFEERRPQHHHAGTPEGTHDSLVFQDVSEDRPGTTWPWCDYATVSLPSAPAQIGSFTGAARRSRPTTCSPSLPDALTQPFPRQAHSADHPRGARRQVSLPA